MGRARTGAGPAGPSRTPGDPAGAARARPGLPRGGRRSRPRAAGVPGRPAGRTAAARRARRASGDLRRAAAAAGCGVAVRQPRLLAAVGRPAGTARGVAGGDVRPLCAGRRLGRARPRRGARSRPRGVQGGLAPARAPSGRPRDDPRRHLQLDLHQQHPGRVPRLRRRPRARPGDDRRPGLQRRAAGCPTGSSSSRASRLPERPG
jgi:hypothetical protein